MLIDENEFNKKVEESKKLFPKRLQYAMDLNNIKAIELSEKTGITKSKISSYLSGRFRAKQDGVYILAKTLNVDPAWLMGLDVPMKDNNIFSYKAINDEMTPLLDIGDIAIVQKVKDNNFENKGTYLIKYESNNIIRKIIDNNNDTVDLIAMNPYYKTITTNKDKIEIIGKVLEAHNSSAFK